MQRPKSTRFSILLISIAISQAVQSQPPLYATGTLLHSKAIGLPAWSARSDSSYQKKTGGWTSYVAPAAMMAYGFTALKNEALQRVDARVQKEVYANHPHASFHADDYLIWAPAAASFASQCGRTVARPRAG